MIIVDTSALVAAADQRDPQAQAVQAVLRFYPGRAILPAPLTGEADYMLTRRLGPTPARQLIRDVAQGLFRVECLEPHEYLDILALSDRYRDLGPGLADLSIVVLARRFDTRRILTFDHRHFRAIEPLQGGSFELIPANLAPTSVD